MINRVLSLTRKLKLKNIHFPRDKNLYRTSFFWNFLRFRKKKWGYQRAGFFKSPENLFSRYDPSKVYIPIYERYFELDFKNENFRLYKFTQYLKYKSLLVLKKKYLGFFYLKKTKTLRDRLVYRNMHSNFNVFDTFLDLMLIRIGGSNHMKEARQLVKNGTFTINSRVNPVRSLTFINNLDYVTFTKKSVDFDYKKNFYDKKKKGYSSLFASCNAPFFNQMLMKSFYYYKINYKIIYFEVIYITSLFYNYIQYFFSTILTILIEKKSKLIINLKKKKKKIGFLYELFKKIDSTFVTKFFKYKTSSIFKKVNNYMSGYHFNYYNNLFYKLKNRLKFTKFFNLNVEPKQNRSYLSKIYTFFPNILNPDAKFQLRYGVKDFLLDILPFPFPINYTTFNFIYFDLVFKNQWHFNVNWYTLRKFLRYNR
jgi:hypothetical protein